MKTINCRILAAVVGAIAALNLHASYDPSTGRWCSRDPIHEISFRTMSHSRPITFREKEINSYLFVLNNPIEKWDYRGLAEGGYVIFPFKVKLDATSADARGLSEGDEVDGFSVKYIPASQGKCSCSKKDIRIVQAIDNKQDYLPALNNPHFDYNPKKYTGTLPPAYQDSYGHKGNLQIYDAPWFGLPTTYTIEDCAICRDGKTNPEKVLGCVVFTWHSDTHALTPAGAVLATDPTSFWNGALTTWNQKHKSP